MTAFSQFRDSYNLPHTNPPPPLDHLINFIGYMSASKLAPSTIKTYISAIAFQQKINNFPDTTKSFIIQKLLIGLSRKNPSLDIRRPITLPLLHAIIQALPHTCHSTYESILFTSAYLLAYFGFLRVGDLTVTMGTSPSRILQANAVSITSQTIRLFLQFSKADQAGTGTTIVIPMDHESLILKQALTKFLSVRPPVEGPLLCHFDNKPLTSYQFSTILTKTLQHLKIPHAAFKSHSFRIGAATAAFIKCIPEHQIQSKGRWKSMCYKKYIRL